MSQVPSQMPPVFSNTTKPSPPPVASHQHVATAVNPNWFAQNWWIVLLVFAVIVVATVVVMFIRGGGFSAGGGKASLATDIEKARKSKDADAYLEVLDISSNRVRIFPLKRLGDLYIFFWDGVPSVFVPVSAKVYFGFGKPLYRAIGLPGAAIEEDPFLLFSQGIIRTVVKEVKPDLDSSSSKAVFTVIQKLTSLVSKYQGELPTLPGIAIEIDIPRAVEALVRDEAMKIKSIMSTQIETWKQVEKLSELAKKPSPVEWGKMAFWLGMMGLVLVLSLAIAKILGVF